MYVISIIIITIQKLNLFHLLVRLNMTHLLNVILLFLSIKLWVDIFN